MSKESCPRCESTAFLTFVADQRERVCSKCGWPGEWLNVNSKDGTMVLVTGRKHRFRRWKEPE